jgi:hypothetical protein
MMGRLQYACKLIGSIDLLDRFQSWKTTGNVIMVE